MLGAGDRSGDRRPDAAARESFPCNECAAGVGELNDHGSISSRRGFHDRIHAVATNTIDGGEGEPVFLGVGEDVGDGVSGHYAGGELVVEVGHDEQTTNTAGWGEVPTTVFWYQRDI